MQPQVFVVLYCMAGWFCCVVTLLCSDDGRKLSKRKSRDELNEIEKQRTKRINYQILSLVSLLEESNVHTKRDKCSILQGYIIVVYVSRDLIIMATHLSNM